MRNQSVARGLKLAFGATMFLGEARTPPDTRIYAIGDVHGCDHLLAAVHVKIENDLARRPIGAHRIIHVGDYVDRGPKTAAVIDRLLRLSRVDDSVTCLGGNHEEILLGFLADPAQWASTFLRFGGVETIASYGVAVPGADSPDGIAGLRDRFAAALPPAHLAFLRTTPFSVQCGDYFFCHAGIRPGIPVEGQDPEDLRWIRNPFLSDMRDHGAVVVHGHTPVEAPEIRRNRINIDTGAVFGGRLTCLVLEDADYDFL